MTTLYDLLGALPHDDAQGLRTAFRNAVKGAHPDIRPGDPDAALKFRQIVNASEILGDDEQRAAYDHLLELARLEQQSASKAALATRIHRVVSGIIGFAGVSAVTVGGYLLFMHMSVASVDPAHGVDAAARAAPEIAVVHPASSPDTAETTLHLGRENAKIQSEAFAASAAELAGAAESVAADNVSPAPEAATSEARSLLARRLIAYRNGDLSPLFAEMNHSDQPDPHFLPAYVDRGVIFYRLQKIDRAFAEVARPKQIEKAGRSKSAVTTTATKPRFHRTAFAAPLPRLFARRAAAQERPRGEGFASLGAP
jgi:curved DNA-binding protein CbpA